MNGVALCAGIGGLELGLRIALGEYRAVCYVEREVYCASVIVARMAESALCEAPVWDDITTFDGRPWCGVVDIITSGDPCQPFSVAGQRRGESDERYLWPHVERIIREVEPEFVFLENVAGAVDIRYEHKAVLESMGYRVEAGLFSAEEVGAPHQRVRVFLLAYNSKSGQKGWRTQEVIYEAKSRIETGTTAKRYGGELGIPISSRRVHGEPGEQSAEGELKAQCQLEPGDGELGLFPPGPSDLDSWRKILEEYPEVEPAVDDTAGSDGEGGRGNHKPTIGDDDSFTRPGQVDNGGPEVEPALCGVSDGPTFRVERLSCLGNAVVPVVAALAFVTLWGRLNNDITQPESMSEAIEL